MSYMDSIAKPKIKAPIISILGSPGVGKSTLAALFPSPVFIQTDNNSETVFQSWTEDKQPSFMPKVPKPNKKKDIKPSEVVLQYLRELSDTSKHDFKTIVFDTSTSLNLLLEEEVVEFDPMEVDNVADAAGGFHKGYKVVAGKHAKIVNACETIRQRGITIVFLCHTVDIKHKNRPDMPDYTVYGLDMYKDSRPYYINHSDAVLYLKKVEITKGYEENKKGQTIKHAKVKTTGERVLITSGDGIFGYVDAKNTFDMPGEIDVPYMTNPILDYVPFLKQYATKTEQLTTTGEAENE